jgi:hypothetical protein
VAVDEPVVRVRHGGVDVHLGAWQKDKLEVGKMSGSPGDQCYDQFLV